MPLGTISEDARQKLLSLHKTRGFWRRLVGGGTSQVRILGELSNCGEPAVIFEIADYALSKDKDIRTATQTAIHKLMSAVPVILLPTMDILAREWTRNVAWHSPWGRLKPADVKQLASGNYAPALLGLASFHNSGLVREAALREMERIHDGKDLPFALLRINDWVSEIRNRAGAILEARMKRQDYAAHFLECLPLVLRLKQCGRGKGDHERIVQNVATLLQSPECRHLLVDGMRSGDRDTRRFCVQQAPYLDDAESRQLLERALEGTDPIIRFWAICRILARRDRGPACTCGAPFRGPFHAGTS